MRVLLLYASCTMKIKKAHRTDADKLTDLTIRSKDYWKYGARQIEEWREELTVHPEYIDDHQAYKLIVVDKIVGFYAFHPESEKSVKLSFLFVDPKYIGKGYGKLLMNDFLKRIEGTDYEEVTLDADPNAEKFYEQFGFKVVGKLASSIKDRFLPIMELKIK